MTAPLPKKRQPLPVLLQWYDTAGTAASLAAVHQEFPCRKGCAWCCHELLVVTDADMRVVEHGLALLTPEQQHAVHERVAAQVQHVTDLGLDTGKGSPVLRALEADPVKTAQTLAQAWPTMPCPFLGRAEDMPPIMPYDALAPSPGYVCGIYDSRPLVCRTHAAKGDDGTSAACRPKSGQRVALLDSRKVHQKAADSFGARPVGVLLFELAKRAPPSVEAT